jgi:hypothetical protein
MADSTQTKLAKSRSLSLSSLSGSLGEDLIQWCVLLNPSTFYVSSLAFALITQTGLKNHNTFIANILLSIKKPSFL